LFRFLLAGGPAFAVAIPLNYALVHWAGLGKTPAYAIVLALQTTVNFLICRAFVFETKPEAKIGKDFLIFLHGNVLFRLADWLVYILLTKYAGLPYLAVQLFNVALFAFLKFEFARRVFEPRK
jgi:putative flippase GtrA